MPLAVYRSAMKARERIKLSNGRRLVCDVVSLAKTFPAYGLIRDIDVRALTEIRKRIRPKPSWLVIMMKAYARIGCRIPQLRQHYVSFPWPHIYQHDVNMAMMVISREHEGEERLFFARFKSPEEESLTQLQERYNHFRTAPVTAIKQFRHQIQYARMPSVLRRLSWWLMINVWASRAPTHFGTWGVSLSTFMDTYGTLHLSPCTSTLGVDIVSRGGISRTLLTFDHRIFDALPACRVYAELVRELHGPIRKELQQMADNQEAAANSASAQNVAEPDKALTPT